MPFKFSACTALREGVAGRDGHLSHSEVDAEGNWRGKWAMRAGPREKIYFEPGKGEGGGGGEAYRLSLFAKLLSAFFFSF